MLKRHRKEGKISFLGKQIIFAAVLLFLGGELAVEIYNPEKYNLNLSPPVDFYQYWGIGLGPKLSGGALKSPYKNLSEYTTFLDSVAVQSGNSHNLSASRAGHRYFSRGMDPTGTPLQYAMFAFMPTDYFHAYGIFLAMQTMMFVGAMVMLFSYKENKGPLFAVLTMTLIACYAPLRNNLADGNLAAMQLFALVALATFYDKALRHRSSSFLYLKGAVFLSALVFLTLMKPNIALTTLILSASFGILCGRKVFLFSVAVAGLVGAALIVATCDYFGSWDVWGDWVRYFPDMGKSFPYLTISGNCSMSLLVAHALNIPIFVAMATILFLLITHGLWVFLGARSTTEPVLEYIKHRTIVLLEDPYLSASLAITVTLALAPLVWIHYYLLSLIPAFWLIAVSPPRRYVEFLGLLSILTTSGMLPYLMGRDDLVSYTAVYGWIPLWFGIQSVIVDRIHNAAVVKETANTGE